MTDPQHSKRAEGPVAPSIIDHLYWSSQDLNDGQAAGLFANSRHRQTAVRFWCASRNRSAMLGQTVTLRTGILSQNLGLRMKRQLQELFSLLFGWVFSLVLLTSSGAVFRLGRIAQEMTGKPGVRVALSVLMTCVCCIGCLI